MFTAKMYHTVDCRCLACEPALDATNRESLIAWLEWNDRNGAYSDEDCKAEGLPVLTLEQAQALYACQSSHDYNSVPTCGICGDEG